MAKKANFENNMDKLGKIVAELEKGDVSLEKAVELYGEGVKLAAECRKQLSEASVKIKEVSGDEPPKE